MTPATAATLSNPCPSEHIIYSYTDDSELMDALTLFAKVGLMRDEAVILIVSAKHADLMRQRLEQEGYEVEELLESRKLAIADAEDVLATFFLDEQRFKIGIESLIEEARAGRGRTHPVRVFDEMVDLIWISNLQATVRLEELGNEAIKSHSVTMLCGYSLGRGRPTSLPAPILACHSRVLSPPYLDATNS
jgi:hypothetical protein